jgi:flagellar motor switch protein FliN/FliY
MGLSQDEINGLRDDGADGSSENNPKSSVIQKMAARMTESVENIIPVLIGSTGEMKVDAHDPVQKQLDELLGSLPENNAYFIFTEPTLTSSVLVGYIDFEMALDLSQKMMGQEGEEELNEALLSALNEAFNNILGAYDTALKEEFGIDIEHGDLKFLEDTVTAEAGMAADTMIWHIPMVGTIDDGSFKLGLLISEAAMNEIAEKHPAVTEAKAKQENAKAEADEKPAEDLSDQAEIDALVAAQKQDEVQAPVTGVSADQPESRTVPTAVFEELAPRESIGETKGIDLILDVPLSVTVELGRKTLSVRDILALNPGSLVELEKLAGEAVDLLVNGKLFAHGEVVVIDENFGVRVSMIITPKERIEKMSDGGS